MEVTTTTMNQTSPSTSSNIQQNTTYEGTTSDERSDIKSDENMKNDNGFNWIIIFSVTVSFMGLVILVLILLLCRQGKPEQRSNKKRNSTNNKETTFKMDSRPGNALNTSENNEHRGPHQQPILHSQYHPYPHYHQQLCPQSYYQQPIPVHFAPHPPHPNQLSYPGHHDPHQHHQFTAGHDSSLFFQTTSRVVSRVTDLLGMLLLTIQKIRKENEWIGT